jgi:hypothetical protein
VSPKIFFFAAVRAPPERFTAGVWFPRHGMICEEMIQKRVFRCKKNGPGVCCLISNSWPDLVHGAYSTSITRRTLRHERKANAEAVYSSNLAEIVDSGQFKNGMSYVGEKKIIGDSAVDRSVPR